MTDKKDDYYQPWLRDPAPTPGSAPMRDTLDQGGLAKPKDEPPVGIDLARYRAGDKPRDPLVKPETIKAGTANLWDRIRDGAEAFADWTMEELVEYEEDVNEGAGHRGRSALLGLVARTP